MRILLAILFMAITVSATAADLELSVGKTVSTTALSYSIGVVGEIGGHKVRIGYADLGTRNMGLAVSPTDYAEDQLAGWGAPPCHWLPMKPMRELFGTVEQRLYSGEYTYSLEVGAALYRSQWQQDICVNAANEPAHDRSDKLNVSPVIGLSVGRGANSLLFQYQNNTQHGDWENGHPSNVVLNVSLRHSF